MTLVEFRGDLWLQKNRVPGLSCGVVCVILRLAVLVEQRLVTDRQTDGRTQGHGWYRGCIASRGKKERLLWEGFAEKEGFYRAMLCIRGTSHGPVSAWNERVKR